MTRDERAPNLERVFEHAIEPLLEEHFYGAGRNIEAEFGVEALRRHLADAADAAPADSGGAQSKSEPGAAPKQSRRLLPQPGTTLGGQLSFPPSYRGISDGSLLDEGELEQRLVEGMTDGRLS